MLVNFLYSNADTVNHVECLDCLIQMGSDVFAEDGEGRTPYDLAQSCNSMPDVIDRLGTAQGATTLVNVWLLSVFHALSSFCC
eukprot:m.163448 g.163448  ORF g.163448 m.163448 type:complete len:83 (+) comp38852_c0_seq33:1558-1806(+)